MMTKKNLDIYRGGEKWTPAERWSPARQLSLLQRGIDRLFDDFMSPTTSFSGGYFPQLTNVFVPLVDVEETENEYFLDFDLPGINKEDIKIEVSDNQLIVSGERKEEHEEKESKKSSRYFTERYYGTFTRVFTLPSAVDSEKIEADYEDGVLHIVVPKSESAKPRQIKLGEGKGTRKMESKGKVA